MDKTINSMIIENIIQFHKIELAGKDEVIKQLKKDIKFYKKELYSSKSKNEDSPEIKR